MNWRGLHRCATALPADLHTAAPRPVDPRDADRSEHYRRHAATQAAWAGRNTQRATGRAWPRLIDRIFKGRGR